MSSSTSSHSLYVRMVDGTSCAAPLPARDNSDGTFHLLGNSDFDAENTVTLLEFIPGDDVKAELRALGPESHQVLLAIKLVRSSAADRDYWAVLFSLAAGEAPPELTDERLNSIAARVRHETDTVKRWHYPAVVEWATART